MFWLDVFEFWVTVKTETIEQSENKNPGFSIPDPYDFAGSGSINFFMLWIRILKQDQPKSLENSFCFSDLRKYSPISENIAFLTILFLSKPNQLI